MQTSDYDVLIKIVIVGESGVGKTCLLQRFESEDFSVNHVPTIAIDFKMKVVPILDKKVKMQIWDTAGQERFHTLTAGFFKCSLKSLARNNRLLLHYRPEIVRVRAELDDSDQHHRSQKLPHHFGRQQKGH